jgi:hypothetical protein
MSVKRSLDFLCSQSESIDKIFEDFFADAKSDIAALWVLALTVLSFGALSCANLLLLVAGIARGQFSAVFLCSCIGAIAISTALIRILIELEKRVGTWKGLRSRKVKTNSALRLIGFQFYPAPVPLDTI